jgi:nicotinate-nucleotide pyrophosphorylase (carboxylating)
MNRNMAFMTIDEIVEKTLQEDLGDGDHTSLATIGPESRGKARLIIKDNGILCGLPVAEKVFRTVDPGLSPEFLCKDGDFVEKGMVAMTVEGRIRSILAAERTVLNFMQRLSGIATYTHRIMQEVKGTHARILDTRKTTPLLRELEKYAVRTGGGTNHRTGLFDMILIKDNHVDYANGIVNAIRSVQDYLGATGKKLKIEIEVRNFNELLEVVSYGGVDRIMFDNFSPADVAEAVKLVKGRYETEASGGIQLGNIRQYAEAGVDFISVGGLTHRFSSLDMSLKAEKAPYWETADGKMASDTGKNP